jgi:membrane protein implicated in regulation of membrane protease activity
LTPPGSAEKKSDAKRPLLIVGIALLGVAAALFLAAALLASSALHVLVPWVFLAGALITLLYFVVRKVALAPEPPKRESMLFGQTTTMEEPRKRDDHRH